MYKYLGYFGMSPLKSDFLLLHMWLELESGDKYLSYYSNITHPENYFVDLDKVNPNDNFIKVDNQFIRNKALIAYKSVYLSLPQRELVKNWETSSCFKDMTTYDYNIKKI